MPQGQPQDADQEFYSDIVVTFVGNGAAAPTAANVTAPPGVTVTWSATGNYVVQLPAAYVAASPPISAMAIATVQATATTDAGVLIRALTTGTTVSAGTFAFQTLSALTPTAADLTSAYTAKILLKVKFATVLVLPS